MSTFSFKARLNGFNTDLPNIVNAIFKNKGTVEAALNESLNQFNFDSSQFQQTSNIFLYLQQMLNDRFKRTDIWFNNCVGRILKQMLKPFKRTALDKVEKISSRTNLIICGSCLLPVGDTQREHLRKVLRMFSPVFLRSFSVILKTYFCKLIQIDLFGCLS